MKNIKKLNKKLQKQNLIITILFFICLCGMIYAGILFLDKKEQADYYESKATSYQESYNECLDNKLGSQIEHLKEKEAYLDKLVEENKHFYNQMQKSIEPNVTCLMIEGNLLCAYREKI